VVLLGAEMSLDLSWLDLIWFLEIGCEEIGEEVD
jgi:hypothetical protein